MPEERRSYVILRLDGLLLHTKPITVREAEWLAYAYAARFLDRRSKARYLSEWGNVMDVGKYLKRLKRLEPGLKLLLRYRAVDIYSDPEQLTGLLAGLLDDPHLSPEARQTVKELLNRIEDFLREPVEPRPVEAPVRYLELYHDHVVLECCSNELKDVVPRPEWYAYKERKLSHDLYGVSIFKDSLWLWIQFDGTFVVAVRRDVDDKEVVAALANDGAVQGFLRWNAGSFREVLREREKELTDRGYEDVVRKAKVVLTTYELLTAGLREEGVPA